MGKNVELIDPKCYILALGRCNGKEEKWMIVVPLYDRCDFLALFRGWVKKWSIILEQTELFAIQK
jgi:hypothetical protein